MMVKLKNTGGNNVDLYKTYFRKVPNKGYYVALEVVERAYQVNKLENLIEDDDSQNYEVIFTEKQVNDMRLFRHCASSFPGTKTTEGFDVYGVDIRIIESTCAYEGNLHMKTFDYKEVKPNEESVYICHFLGNQYQIKLSDTEKENVEKIKSMLKERFHLENDEKLAEFLRHKYMMPMQDEWKKSSDFMSIYYKDIWSERCKELCEKNNINIPSNLTSLYNNSDLRESLRILDRSMLEPTKNEYNKIYEDLLLLKKVPIKWTSEFELFKLVKKNFEDAIFQYSPRWLFPQRFDIYVPSINTAFEYQGIQHFQNVEFFGGVEGLEKRILLDKTKKEKSKINRVNLIEWIYDETINKMTLNKKLIEIGLNAI